MSKLHNLHVIHQRSSVLL